MGRARSYSHPSAESQLSRVSLSTWQRHYASCYGSTGAGSSARRQLGSDTRTTSRRNTFRIDCGPPSPRRSRPGMMCGIAGALLPEGPSGGASLHSALDVTVRQLAHRGPDGCGCHVDSGRGVALGHTRLAIIDLSPAGQQPMSSPDGCLTVTFNGEIYN